MPQFSANIALPDINPLFDLASIDKNVNAINGGRLTNQLASNTLGSNTQIAANVARSGSLANDLAAQKGPLEVSLLRQQAGQESSPVFDKLMGVIGGGTAQPAAPTGGSAPANGDFIDRMNQSESSGRPGVVNAGGYAGNFQFGAPRLSELGLYTPAPGEINGKTWNGQMAGTFNIPGFPDVKTKADFLANPQAQRAAMGVQVADIDQAIAQTPGADKFDRNGLRAVAHLGGVDGMQKYVATGGQYNPGDDPKAPGGGTHLSDYYGKFSGPGGAAALQQAHGHPEGPLPSVAAAPGVTLAPDAQTAGAPAAPAPVQTASRGPMPGDTANDGTAAPGFGPNGQPLPAGTWDASPVTAAAQPAPTGQGVNDVMARLRNMPQVQNPNALLDVAAPTGSTAPAPQNVLAPVAAPVAAAPVAPPTTPAAAPATGMNAPQVQQAQALMRQATQIEMIAAQAPNDPRVKALAAAKVAELRGQAQVLMKTDTFRVDPVTKVQTNAVTGEQKPPAMGRITHADDGRNIQVLDGAGNVIKTISKGGYDLQKSDYERDAKELSGIADAGAQAQSNQIRLTQMQQLASRISTGAGGGKRADWANLAETMGMPDVAKRLISSNDGDAAAAQEFAKMALQSAGSQERGVLGSRGGYQAIKLFQSANPSLELRPDANRKIINMQLIGAQADADYAKGALAYANQQGDAFRTGGKYTPLSHFDQQWQEQRNPQIYAAAMGALNGDSFDKWTKALNTKSPADVQAVLSIVRRAAPGSTVIWADGSPHSVGQGQ